MSITSDFSKFKKIDAHSHIGTFGSPFNIHFNADLLLKQMEEFNIERRSSVPTGTNEETVAAFKAHPDKIIPLMWINCAGRKTMLSQSVTNISPVQSSPFRLLRR